MDSADQWLHYLHILQATLPLDVDTQALASIALDQYVEQLVAICISDRDQADRCKHFQRASDDLRERLEGLCEKGN